MGGRVVPRRTAAVAVAGVLAAGSLVACGGGNGGGGQRGPRAVDEPTTAPVGRPSPGAADAGDPYIDGIGNGGYDVGHYDLSLAWDPETGGLDGDVTVEAVATQWLSRLDLDLVGFEVERVAVGTEGAEAVDVEVVRRGERELVVTPPEPIGRGDRFTVEVAWAGVPQQLSERSGFLVPGWVSDGDEAHVIGEPDGASSIFPVNDHPTDKATYDLRVTVPAGPVVAANGTHTGTTPGPGGTETWSFEVADPMAAYLLQVVVGNLRTIEATGPEGLPIRHVVDEDVPSTDLTLLDRVPAMIDAFDDLFGPYPFDLYGVVVVDEELGLALENQTLSLFGTDTVGDEAIMAHELAHQWFGDHVGPGTWRDTWLNEGFATYAQWLWLDSTGQASIDTLAREATAVEGLDIAPADPGPDGMFGPTVYLRGALTLHVLRHRVGDDAFFGLLRAWVERYGGRTGTTADFESLAATVTVEDLVPLFDAWLHTDEMPALDEWV